MQERPGGATAESSGRAASVDVLFALTAYAPSGLAFTDGSEHRLEYANPEFARLIGSPADSLAGRPVCEIIRTPSLNAQLDSVLAEREPRSGVPIHTDDGGTYLLSVWPVATDSGDGGVVIQLTCSDIDHGAGDGPAAARQANGETAQQLLEQQATELREVNARLVRAALHEEQLAEQALAASRAKSEFLAMVSHELRTPLTAVIGYTDMLRTGLGGLNEKGASWVDRIRLSAWHLREIVDDLIGTISENRSADEIVLAETGAGEIATEAMAMIEPAASAKGLETRLSIPSSNISLNTDRRKLRQILTNLLSNALKFTDRGYIELDVEQTADAVVFRVRDTGIGIDEADQERIFQPFVQVDSSTTRRFGGCGLGLGLSRRYAHALGGDLTVASAPGMGSTFVVTLPKSAAKDPTEAHD